MAVRIGAPGYQYVAVRASSVLVERSGGHADLRREQPMDTASTMMAYSMSKTITAVALLRLMDEDRIGLDDPLSRHLEAHPYGEGVTIRQLIAHTAGVPNPIPLRWVHPASAHASFAEHDALAAVLRDHPRLSSPPGARYRYSNIGYWLLGAVVERVTGTSFTSFVCDEIARPLGLTADELGCTISHAGRHATGYLEKYSVFNLLKGLLIDRALVGEYRGRWLEVRAHYPNGPAFGGLVGTARAFGRFLQDQLRDRSVLLRDRARELLFTPQRTTRGAVIPMTLGWHVGRLGTSPFFFKEGGGGGFHCMMRLYRSAGVGTVLMTNATGVNVARALDALDREILG